MGCISVNMTHKQNSNGSAEVTQTTDFSGLVSATEGLGDLGGENNDSITTTSGLSSSDFEDTCDEVEEGVECTVDVEKSIVTLKKTFTSENAFYTFETESDFFTKNHKLTVDELPNFKKEGVEEADGAPTGKITDTTNLEQAKLLQTYGVEMTYIVEMPGKITSAEGSEEIEKNVATFDLLEMMDDGEPIVVESKETGLFCMPGLVLLGVLGLGTYMFRRA